MSKVQSGQRTSLVARDKEVDKVWTQYCSGYDEKVVGSCEEKRNKTAFLFRGYSHTAG